MPRPLPKCALPRLPLLLLALAISGCAGQIAYRDGHDLIAHDQIEAGLRKYQEAVAADPDNGEYRAAWLQARDRAVQRYLATAARLASDGQPERAAEEYRHVLVIDPQNERANGGLRGLDAGRRQQRLFDEAQAAFNNQQYEPARLRLNAILTENPGHAPARALLAELTEKTAPAPLETALARAYRQPISIEFRDAPLKQVFEVIAHRSGLNFVFDKDVKTDTKASVFLKNSTVESAIYYLLTTNQLDQQVMDANTILIYPNVAAKQKEYQEMVVKTFFLANAEAKLVANTLKTILKTRDVVVDEKLNLLIVRDSPEAIRLAERLIALQDAPEPEVVLDVEIIEVSRSRLTALGIAWPGSVALTPLSTSGGTSVTLADLSGLNRGTIGVTGVSATLNANTTDGDSNLLANPRIRVRNKEKAKILIGDKLPVVSSTVSSGVGGFVSDSVSYVDVGLTLNAEPTIYLNNEVAIRISLEVSNLAQTITTSSGSTVYQIGTRQASTMLQLKDGENQVLAGLLNNQERSSGNKIPGAGDIPILGRLFGSGTNNNQKTEIVLSITPHIVRNVQRPEASASEFSAGTESNFRRRPDLTERALVQLPGAPVRSGQTVIAHGAPAPAAVLQPPVPAPTLPPPRLPPLPTAAPVPAEATPPAATEAGAVTLSTGQPVPLQPAPMQRSAGQPVPVGAPAKDPATP